MSVKVIVEFTTNPGQRDGLLAVIEGMMAESPPMPGSLGAAFYKSVDDPDLLVEIADWESVEARAAVYEQIAAAGGFGPIEQMLAAPMRTTVLEVGD